MEIKRERNCLFCNSVFIKSSKSRFGPKKYCSAECLRKYNLFIKNVPGTERTIKKCKTCLEEFLGAERTLYCSDSCKIPKLTRMKTDSARIKEELVAYKGNKCQHCDILYPLAAMCFHHREDKKFTLDSMNLFQKKREEIFKEVEKCDLLCHNCHAILHEKISNDKDVVRHKNDITKRNIKRNKKRWLLDMFGGSCSRCGFKTEYLSALSFDHLKDKTFNINHDNMYGKTNEELIVEASKCQVLCMNCHIEKNTWSNRQGVYSS